MSKFPGSATVSVNDMVWHYDHPICMIRAHTKINPHILEYITGLALTLPELYQRC